MNKFAFEFTQATLLRALSVTIIATCAVAGVITVTRLFGGPGLTISQTSTQKDGTFDVTGEGEATVVPDKAEVTVGIQVTQTTVAQTQNEMNRVNDAIIDALDDLGVDKDDIKTISYNLYPTYDNIIYPLGEPAMPRDTSTKTSAGSAGSGVASSDAGESLIYPEPAPDILPDKNRRVRGYTGETTLLITVTNFEILNEVIDAATAAGANQVGGVQFSLTKETQDKVEKEARAEAIEQAKEKAQELANLAGMRLGRVINVSESPYGMPYFARSAVALDAKVQEAETQVQPGSTTVRYSITLSYETY